MDLQQSCFVGWWRVDGSKLHFQQLPFWLKVNQLHRIFLFKQITSGELYAKPTTMNLQVSFPQFPPSPSPATCVTFRSLDFSPLAPFFCPRRPSDVRSFWSFRRVAKLKQSRCWSMRIRMQRMKRSQASSCPNLKVIHSPSSWVWGKMMIVKIRGVYDNGRLSKSKWCVFFDIGKMDVTREMSICLQLPRNIKKGRHLKSSHHSNSKRSYLTLLPSCWNIPLIRFRTQQQNSTNQIQKAWCFLHGTISTSQFFTPASNSMIAHRLSTSKPNFNQEASLVSNIYGVTGSEHVGQIQRL